MNIIYSNNHDITIYDLFTVHGDSMIPSALSSAPGHPLELLVTRPAGSAKAPAEARIGAAEAFTGGLAHFKRDLVLKHFFKHSKKDKSTFLNVFKDGF